MFTGLVEGTGTVASLRRAAEGLRITVRSRLAAEIEAGASVALDGACLTAVKAEEGAFDAEVMEETLRRTSLGRLQAGDRVNLELPVRAGERMGGHVVQGHVDGTGTVESVEEEGFARLVRIAAPAELLPYVVEKGSIAVDGVSLTVAEVDGEGFSVSLVPETLERTTLGTLERGREVNLEVDVLAKYVEKLVSRRVPA